MSEDVMHSKGEVHDADAGVVDDQQQVEGRARLGERSLNRRWKGEPLLDGALLSKRATDYHRIVQADQHLKEDSLVIPEFH